MLTQYYSSPCYTSFTVYEPWKTFGAATLYPISKVTIASALHITTLSLPIPTTYAISPGVVLVRLIKVPEPVGLDLVWVTVTGRILCKDFGCQIRNAEGEQE
jgi:hypothetical protein